MNESGQAFKIRFVNRLDRDTSGLIIVAKNAFAQEELTKQMKEGKVSKRYNALLCGIIESDRSADRIRCALSAECCLWKQAAFLR